MRNFSLLLFILSLIITACQSAPPESTENETDTVEEPADSLRYEQENHLQNIQQLTFGGNNAEAYFSFDNQYLSLQIENPAWDVPCDQIYTMPISGYTGDRPQLISTGTGRTTCAFFMPGDSTILYASTHLGGEECPQMERKEGDPYTWPIFADYDIFVADLNGNIIKQLTDDPGYDAEATLSPDGSKIVFTSTRSGDLELWTMNTDGSDQRQVTDGLGYDGGAFFSPDGKKLVFRASRPQSPEAQELYKGLLANGKVQPTQMEIYTCNVDGSDLQQITSLGKANWAPYFHPSGEKILFASNHHSDSGRQFNIFSIDINGENLTQITFDETFDAFPMFSYDGKKIVFSSNRFNGGNRDTNVFIADWVD